MESILAVYYTQEVIVWTRISFDDNDMKRICNIKWLDDLDFTILLVFMKTGALESNR